MLALGVSALLLAAAPAAAAPSPAQMLSQIRSGARSCASLSQASLDRIGEYAMERMVGSERAHESMDSLMGDMMGGSWDRRMHVALGERASGCRGALPSGFGAMMGAVGMMTGRDAVDYGPGMMGEGDYGYRGEAGPEPRHYGPGWMMDDRFGEDDGGGPGWLVAVLATLVVALLAALAWVLTQGRRRGPSGETALQVLQRRYASGEIDSEEYERRRAALGGPG